MRCEEVREILPAYIRDGEPALAVRRHLARCPDCRTELAQYDSMLDTMGDLQTTVAEPPRGLKAALVAIPTQPSRVETVRGHVVRNRNAYLGGAVALAGVAGAALWRTRRRVATA
jgi:predicted anti-sigma-YlaC factor YlaD